MNKKIILMTSVLTALPGYAIANANVPFIDDAIEHLNAQPGDQNINAYYIADDYTKSDDGNEMSITNLDVALEYPQKNSSASLSFGKIKSIGTKESLHHAVWVNGFRAQINNPMTDMFGLNNFLNIINDNGGINITYEATLSPSKYSFKNVIDIPEMTKVEINYAVYAIGNNDLTTIYWKNFEAYDEGDEKALQDQLSQFGFDYVEIKIKENGIVDYILENVVNKGLPAGSPDRMDKSDLATLIKLQSLPATEKPGMNQHAQSLKAELIQFIEDSEQIVIKIDLPNDNTSFYDEFLKDYSLNSPENDEAFEFSKFNSAIEIR
jgi:hypothetical protein